MHIVRAVRHGRTLMPIWDLDGIRHDCSQSIHVLAPLLGFMFLVPAAVLHDGAGVNTVRAADSEFGFVVDGPVRLKRSLNPCDRIRVHQYVFVLRSRWHRSSISDVLKRGITCAVKRYRTGRDRTHRRHQHGHHDEQRNRHANPRRQTW